MTTEYRVLGTPTPKVEGVEKATGRAHYAADEPATTALRAKALLSSRPHARIVRIDTAEARRLPGVRAVITGDDVTTQKYGRAIKDLPVLAQGVVRYVGERIAAVAADDEETMQRALDLIEVEYEDLPAVFDIAEAIAETAPVLHPEYSTYPGAKPLARPSNIYFTTVADRGDLDAGFAQADVVVERTYTTQRQHQAYLEPHTTTVSVEGEHVDVWTNSKVPYSV